MRENLFQHDLVRELRTMLPGCIILKNDANYLQGVPDLIVLYKNRWAALECKASVNASRQPNQSWYIAQMDQMSFSRFIYPENKEQVLNELQQAFGLRRKARIPKSE